MDSKFYTMATIGEFISPIRIIIKAVKQDAFVTDRFLYSLSRKHGSLLVRREDNRNKILMIEGLWQTLPFVPLIEVDRVEAECSCVVSGCMIKRTEEKLPSLMMGYYSPLIKSVTCISGTPLNPKDEYPFTIVTPSKFGSLIRSTNFKYNRNKYCWYENGYLYFPDLEWDAVRVTGVFDGDVSPFCGGDSCTPKQSQPFPFPEHLHAAIMESVLKDLGFSYQLPSDPVDDKINPLR